MSKIIKVELENFQSHRSSKIDFDKGLNVITGPSDSGKSAIIRAIRWVLYNEPRGADFISANTNECRVSLTFENGIKIVRERTKTKNRYILHQNGEEQVYEGFGNTVPQEVIDSHQIRNIFLDTDQKTIINLSSQLEGPFLLSESGATRAKAIGRILGIHYLDSAARKASSTILEYKKEYAQKLEEHKKVKEDLQGYKIYEVFSTKLENAQKTYEHVEKRYGLLKNLQKLSAKLKAIDTDIKTTSEILKSTENLQKLEELSRELNQNFLRKMNLDDKSAKLNDLQRKIDNAKNTLSKTKDLHKFESHILDLDIKTQKLKKHKDYKVKYQAIRKEIELVDKHLNNTQNLSDLQQNYKNLEELKEKLLLLTSYNHKIKDVSKHIASEKSSLEKCKNHYEISTNIENLALRQDNLMKLKNIVELKRETEGRIQKGKLYLAEQNNNLNKLLSAYKEKLSLLEECPICDTIIDNQKTLRLIQKYKGVK